MVVSHLKGSPLRRAVWAISKNLIVVIVKFEMPDKAP